MSQIWAARVPNLGQFQKRPDFCSKFSEIPIFVPNFQKILIFFKCLNLQIIIYSWLFKAKLKYATFYSSS